MRAPLPSRAAQLDPLSRPTSLLVLALTIRNPIRGKSRRPL
jgi:hypothetical protein